MVRSMFSGVSGLRSHQTRMDTIGNNIANVNTYGFKSGRTTFRDIYYQSMRTASQPTAAIAGMNPSSVGYGTKVGSVDLMMGRSTFSMTDQTMDIAIDGEGFLQVQDQAGNIYYTRAGMLNFDAAGNLVDMQGNFVLGINGDPTGREGGTERIQVVLGPVPPTPASVVQTVNGKEFTISAENPTIDGNLNINFTENSQLADGQVVAEVSATGIIIQMHPDNTYQSLADFNTAINTAITEANNNTPHVAGNFTVSYTGPASSNPFAPGVMPEGGYKASDIVSVDYNVQLGSASFGVTNAFGGVYPSGKVGTTFGANFQSDEPAVSSFKSTYDAAGRRFDFALIIDGVTYEGSVSDAQSADGKFLLRNGGSETDFIEMQRPSFKEIYDAYLEGDITGTQAEAVYTPAALGSYDAGDKFTFGNYTYTVPASFPASPAATDHNNIMNALATGITNSGGEYTAEWNGINMVLTARAKGEKAAGPGPITRIDTDVTPNANVPAAGAFTNGVNPVGRWLDPATGAPWATADTMPGSALGGSAGTNPICTASGASKALGFSSTSFALRGGTAGGPQTIADMTGISISPNGVIVGWDAQGLEITIGRIDVATFANPSGLNQSGSSNFTVSANSGPAQLTQPGMNGAGKLVGGTLELSNVDLSREFSDMITTQRGYQANSRIITVSDTMLEELINLKR